MSKIKVLVVDDSAFVRKVFTEKLSNDPDIEVIGSAVDPYVARDMIVERNPDVILLDIEMPRMDGLTFLGKIMKYFPKKVIVVSSLAESGGEVALKAVELGAIDVVAKPGNSYSVEEMTEQLIDKIKAVHAISLKKIQFNNQMNSNNVIEKKQSMIRTTNKIIAIGASTGGTEAIQYILQRMPVNCPPIIIVQHMPMHFTKAFANRLNEICEIKVKEAENRDIISPGKALIAPGNLHMELSRSGAVYNVKLINGPMVHHQRPAVDVLFQSVAKYAGKNAVGVLLTGMGKDGAQGLLSIKNSGAITLAQDEKSCVVYGMPREAVELGAVQKIIPLNRMTQEILIEAAR
ncbi:MAG: Response regulator receiver modulated CheB methylesterase [Herbinix sp.]|jgi:two-component system chemotaxis response regulator CheB|nr:Response regulator receiver modulated CheB methylesterase [Herbinix sp.]